MHLILHVTLGKDNLEMQKHAKLSLGTLEGFDLNPVLCYEWQYYQGLVATMHDITGGRGDAYWAVQEHGLSHVFHHRRTSQRWYISTLPATHYCMVCVLGDMMCPYYDDDVTKHHKGLLRPFRWICNQQEQASCKTKGRTSNIHIVCSSSNMQQVTRECT